MVLPKTILVPTDFGDAAEAAVSYAVALAEKLAAEVVLLHTFEVPVMSFPEGAMIATADLVDQLQKGAQAGLDHTLARHRSEGVPVRGLVKQGDPWRAILDTAEEVSARLIVMGTHGRRGLPRALIGSVAERVVRSSPVPVLTVHAQAGAS